jgi:Fe-S-cluster containining protein
VALACRWSAAEQKKLAQRLGRLIDGSSNWLHASARIACAPGCNACCHNFLFAIPAEILAVYDQLKRLPDAQRAELIEDMRAYVVASEPQRDESYIRFRRPCPLLKDGLCSVYASRPLTCHGIFAQWRESCDQALKSELSIPLYSMHGELAAVGRAQDAVTRLQGTQRIPFIPTLLAILEDPEQAKVLETDSTPFVQPIQRPWHQRFDTPANDLLGGPPRDPGLIELLTTYRSKPYQEVISGFVANTTYRCVGQFATSPSFFSIQDQRDWRAHLEQSIDHALTFEPWNAAHAFWGLTETRPISIGKHGGNLAPLMAKFGTMVHDRIAEKLAPDLLEPLPKKRKPGKLRVGFIGDFGDKSSSNWSLGWVRNFARDDFELHVIKVYGPEEAYSFAFKDAADHYYRLAGHPFEVVRAIREMDLDYLIFTDLGDAPTMTQFAMFRMARRQAAAWGTALTSGIRTIDDYISSHEMEPANGDEHYTENLVRLPGHGLWLTRPGGSQQKKTRADFGLPPGYIVAYPQYVVKWNPEYDHVFSKLSHRLSNPIVMVEMGEEPELRAFKNRMAALDVRIQWVPWMPLHIYRDFLRCLDVLVDSPSWSGGLTAMHALSAGVPVVHFPGETMRQRLARAFLVESNVPGLVAKDLADLVDLALDPDRVQAAMSSYDDERLFENRAALRAVEAHIRAVSSE